MSGAQGTHRRSTPPEAGIDARAALQRSYGLGPHDYLTARNRRADTTGETEPLEEISTQRSMEPR